MSVDPLSAVGDIHQLSSTLSGLGSQLSAVASSGGFGAVLSQVNSEMAAISGGGSADEGADTEPAGTESLTSDPVLTGPMPSTTASPSLSSAPTGAAVVADAEQYLGVPYQWGGTSPQTGFDCSGLVQHVYADLGIDLPRTSEEQATVGAAVPSLADAQPGDLVFFAGSDGTASSPGHVGIYIGNGQMIDAPQTGENVQVQAVGDPVSIRRVIPSGSPVTSLFSAMDGSGGASSASTDAEMDALGVPASLQSVFESAGATYGVSPTLLAAVAKQESGFDPDAVSGAGAQGLMQIMPATAAGLGIDPTDPVQAVDGAAQLLSGYLNSYGGSVPLALAAYNAGPAAVSEYGGVPPYAQTQNYVSSITSMLSGAEAEAA